jgi:chromosome segregation protein
MAECAAGTGSSPGEGAAEAARLEAENRFAELEADLPALRGAVEAGEARAQAVAAELSDLQLKVIASERALAAAADAERSALRALDQAEAAKARIEARRAELAASASDLAEQRSIAEAEAQGAEARRAELPDPATGRAQLAAAQARHDASRQACKAPPPPSPRTIRRWPWRASARNTQRADIRAGRPAPGMPPAASPMTRRFEEIEEERAVVAAKPPSLMREIEAGDEVRTRITAELAAAEAKVTELSEAGRQIDARFNAANEALASAREARAGAVARAENEEARRAEMAGISGERFQCPPPLLPERFEFALGRSRPGPRGIAEHDKLVADRERLGPVNLRRRRRTGRGRGAPRHQPGRTGRADRSGRPPARLDRQSQPRGRERLRAAFEAVDGHFRGCSPAVRRRAGAPRAGRFDDPLEAGLEIYAQPPGKRLQSLTLLSGGEQALTAVALIFALFLTNPAPICVLDEVDAPLDDANIERFCDLLDAMVKETETRYLIVTHNAVTMSRMHRLFGVTMVERASRGWSASTLAGRKSCWRRSEAERSNPGSRKPRWIASGFALAMTNAGEGAGNHLTST